MPLLENLVALLLAVGSLLSDLVAELLNLQVVLCADVFKLKPGRRIQAILPQILSFLHHEVILSERVCLGANALLVIGLVRVSY